ncbi:MAG: hypothetical protein RLZZ450_6379 [Pseudomonadota bacterium]|jgi:hypothetical protein
MKQSLVLTALATLLAGTPRVVHGQEASSAPSSAPAPAPTATAYVPDGSFKASERPQGLAYGVTLAANLNIASNRDVVGQINGNSVLFGASFLGNLDYLHDRHEWLNTGSLAETWSRTPALGTFVKSNDQLNLQSLYNFFLREWTGPFARIAVQSSILKTDRVSATSLTYVRDTDGATTQSSRFRLASSFQPFTLNEGLGWFFQPIRSDVLSTSLRVGAGGRHTFADGARAITDEKDLRGIVYTDLKDVHQAGAELFAGIDGKELGGRLLYNLGVSALFPLLNNDHTSRSILELTRVGVLAACGMGVTSWLSVNYQLKVVRDVQLIDALQVTNSLLLSLQYTKSSPTPGAKKTDAERASERIAALETRATAAELRAAAAESKLHTVEPAALPEPPAALRTPVLPIEPSAPTDASAPTQTP